MPTYQYACTECDHRFDAVQSFSDPSLTVCPVCGGKLRKVFSSVGIVFKGSGFYRTDSRSGSGSAVAKSESGSEGSGSTSTETKTEKKADKADTKAAPAAQVELPRRRGVLSFPRSSDRLAGRSVRPVARKPRPARRYRDVVHRQAAAPPARGRRVVHIGGGCPQISRSPSAEQPRRPTVVPCPTPASTRASATGSARSSAGRGGGGCCSCAAPRA